MIKAVLFDMDGVIVNSEHLQFESHKNALAKKGIKISMKDYMDFGICRSTLDFYKNISEYKKVDFDIEKTRKLKKEFFINNVKTLKSRKGVIKLLKDLKKEFKIGLVSSSRKEIISSVLRQLNIENLFEVILSGADISNNKPHPDPYLTAARIIGEPPEDCIAIEDSFHGLKSAKNAGIKCIVIPSEYTINHDFEIADLVIKSFKELNIQKIKEL